MPTEASSRGRRRAVLVVGTVLVSVGISLLGAELVLRAAGRTPWKRLVLHANEPVTHEPDPVLGWRAKPGRHVLPPYAPGGRSVAMRILPNGARATAPDGERGDDRRPELAFVGGSYTQGWGVADSETYPWRVQEALPQLRVTNHGTSAYGTVQSLLRMRELLSDPTPPAAVLYGMIGHHEVRNVAHPAWLRTLGAYARRGAVATPWCGLTGDGALACHPPRAEPAWPGREHLALVHLLETAWTDLRGGGSSGPPREVTQAVLLEMAELARAEQARFGVVLLTLTPEARRHYARWLRRHSIPFADCAEPLRVEDLIQGEIHPDAHVHARWARCIQDQLGGWLREVAAQPSRAGAPGPSRGAPPG